MLSRRLLFLLQVFCYSACLTAQSIGGPARVYGPSDGDIPTPVHSTKPVSDVNAIQAVIDFVAMTNISGWTGMTGSGTITFDNRSGESDPAHLEVRGSSGSRLEVQGSAGQVTTIFHGQRGAFISASGTRTSVSSDIAALGLLSFPRLLTPGYPRKTTVLTDQGNVTINGKALHRITFDDPSTDSTGSLWRTVDLYFDPSTKQLSESVAFVHLSSADPSLYTVETTYSDYRTVGNITLPYQYSQSLNGNLQWTLQLNTIVLSAPDKSLFFF